MADCSQLSEKIVRLGMALAVKKNLQSFDDVVYELRQIFPEITREYVQDAFLEAHARRKKVRTETEKILRSIYMTPIFEKRTRERAKQIEEYLETGEWPLPKKAAGRLSALHWMNSGRPGMLFADGWRRPTRRLGRRWKDMLKN